jgi:F-type H+-transporting ATPase subunit b
MFSLPLFRKSLFRRFSGLVLAGLMVSPLSSSLGLGFKLAAQEQGSQPARAASQPGASEGGRPTAEPKSAETKAAETKTLVFTWVNFAVLVVVLWLLTRKKLPALLKARTESIQKGIEEARKTSEEAGRRLTEVEGRLSRLDAEITEMRREADEGARSEEKRMLAEVEGERQRIVTAAEQEIAMAAAAARRDLKSYAAALAVDLAEKKIRVDKDADQALVREFTASLGRDGN